MTILPDNSAFFIMEVEIRWNPFNKVAQDHRKGTIDRRLTNIEREKRGLRIPWEPGFAELECKQQPIL